MDKQHIIDEIRRTARANKGVALGWRRFETETGIKYSDWYGKFWTRWGDAVREAGLQANRMGEPFADEVLLEKLINLTRQLGRVPVQGDVLMARRKDPAFPSEKVFRRFGSKPQRAARVIAYCELHSGFEDVAKLWREIPAEREQVQQTGANGGCVRFRLSDEIGAPLQNRENKRRRSARTRACNPAPRENFDGARYENG